MSSAIIIGGGLGGLAASIRLRAQGWDVSLLEGNDRLGGKCNYQTWNGYHFDTGPSVLTMPFIVDELFAAAGKKREDYLELTAVEPGCRYSWPDGSVFEAPGKAGAFREAIARTFPGEEKGFDRFYEYTRKLWEISGPAFLYNPLDLGLVKRMDWGKALSGLTALRPTRMHREVRRFFRDSRLIQLFDRFATYNGSDPFRTPATFNVISYVELAFGSWSCRGGMYGLVSALERLAAETGVEIRKNAPVQDLAFSRDGARVEAARLRDGEHLTADHYIVNADAISALTGPLCASHPKAGRWRKRFAQGETSTSGFVLLLALDRRTEGLASHNVAFNADYRREFRELFDDPRALSDPTLYVSIPRHHDPALAPQGQEGWFVLVNAPSLDRTTADEWPVDYADFLIERLEARFGEHGFSSGSVRWREARNPQFFASQYGSWHGSLYGLASNNPLAAFLRIKNRGPAANLAFAGGSAHPGGGIPLVLLSGKMAAEAVLTL